MKQTIFIILAACIIMLTSCNNVKPLITHPEEHYYEKAHAPLEIKHNYFDGIAEPIALIVAFSLVAVPLALLSYWASPDSQPK